MKKNMNENFEITVDEMTEIFGDTPVEMSFREVKEGMDSFFGLMGLTVELVNLIRKEDEAGQPDPQGGRAEKAPPRLPPCPRGNRRVCR